MIGQALMAAGATAAFVLVALAAGAIGEWLIMRAGNVGED